jgi:predicted ATPase/DNA-binding SARP family transcriptional activator/DNA-binding CsgD family transcriptional regulator/Tfp pilus assembly protein PilF
MRTEGTPRPNRLSVDRGMRGPEGVRVWMLGGFRVSVGTDRTIEQGDWRLRKAASLVKLLALAPGHRLHREQAVDLLWPEMARTATANNLRQALHVARKTLDPDLKVASGYVSPEGESLVLCPKGNLWVDAEAFEEAASSARRSRDPAAYGAALELYAGELLPADRYEEWTEERRLELGQLRLALLVELAGLCEERGEHERGIEALRRVLLQEPAREEAHASLMRLYALAGRRQEAILQYERLSESLFRELGTEPTAESDRLHDEIRWGRFPAATSPYRGAPSEEFADFGSHNLPSSLTSFVGRERELVEIRRLLAMGRMLTLTGAGGSGKTRLAVEVARGLVGSYPDGAWLVELAPLSDPDLVPRAVAGTVAKAVEVRERPGEPLLEALLEALGDKELLLVLDNCEHLPEAVARTGEAILHSCPRLRVLATSREPLGIRGEVLWQVGPLSLPDAARGGRDGGTTVEGLMRSEAVRLFVDRARLKLPDFALTEENAPQVAAVCRKLDGIPLAIELATARIGSLVVEQVAQRLEASLDFLKGASRTAEARQRTLRATIDWGYDLLSGEEQSFFRRLSAFSGGWTLEEAEAVCTGGAIGWEDVLDLLGGLVDKSLVVVGTGTGGALRYRMLEPIRRYAGEKLAQSEDAEGVKDRHADFFLALAEEAEPELGGSRQGAWLDRLEGEHDNLRAALSWLLARRWPEPAVRMGAALWRFWFTRGHLSEGTGWLERVLSEGEPRPSPARAKALEGLGWLLQFLGEYARARATYEEMLELSRASGDKADATTALNSLGTVAAQQGDPERAREYLRENLEALEDLEEEIGTTATTLKRFHALALLGYLAITEEGDYARGATLWEESLALARKAGDTDRIRNTLSNLGYAEVLRGNHDKARAHCEEALALAQDLGDAGTGSIASTLVNLGLAALGQGENERARQLFEEALLLGRGAGRKPQIIDTLEGMASLAAIAGEATRAARLWGAAEAARGATGIALSPAERAFHEPYLAPARSRVGEAAWEDALGRGRAMSLEEAAEYAGVEDTDRSPSPVPGQATTAKKPLELTPREVEVAGLIAQGFTNRQVSQELSISERTAGNHVAKILKKLGLSSRAQIASWATQTRLAPLRSDQG